MKNNYFKFSLVSFFLITFLFCQFPAKDFEIVESIPLETELDNAKIRNTTEVWLELIRSAQKSIDLEQFYFANKENSQLEKVIQALKERADHGVKIRLIAENNMAETYPGTINRLKKHKNIKTRIISVFNEQHGVQHSKYFIIDEEKVFLGSQNFDWRALEHIHEIGLCINHQKYAQQMTEIFELDWQQSLRDQLRKTQKYGEKTEYTININQEKIKFYPTASPYFNMPHDFYSDELAIIELIDNAQESVCIQLLSYSPSDYENYYHKIDNAIRRASLRSVKVEILLSDWCTREYEIPYLKSLQVLPNIEIKLSSIPQYSSGYIPYARVEHCKYMIVDNNISWVGTSNWKKDYFHNSRNLGLIVKSEQINTTLQNIFDKSWHSKYSSSLNISKEYKAKQYGEK
ncbi:MAG: hypothetical protein K9M80_08080 [Candidatus Marinimicrobia bacterium]|nr:hypothetical protein [Candidatus Neomarinimicrobiota bacterium]